jgi:dynein heavy chain 2, cytosolic
VRFGKTLIVQEVDSVEALLFPIIRKDLTAQGPRFVIPIGDKVCVCVTLIQGFSSFRSLIENLFVPTDDRLQ